MKKLLTGFIACCILLNASAQAIGPAPSQEATQSINSEATANFAYSLVGPDGSTLLVDSISNEEYEEMTNILYPNGLINSQGQDIAGIENLETVRANFISNHIKAYSLDSQNNISEISLIPFNVSLEDKNNGSYTWIFYKATIGDDSFVFPSEWGSQPCGFLNNSKENIYLAYTDMGIWRIDPVSMQTSKLTSDLHMGKTQLQVADDKKEVNEDWYLSWIENVSVSPDGRYIAYRTNRDCNEVSQTSIWCIDLSDGSEQQIDTPQYNNDIVGFLNEKEVVVGSLDDTRIINAESKKITNLSMPNLPNICVTGVNDGSLIYTTYSDSSSNTTAVINQVNVTTGSLIESTRISGYLNVEPKFSTSGKIAIGCGTDPDVGINDVMIIDPQLKEEKLLSEYNADISGNLNEFQWINDDILMFESQQTDSVSKILFDPTQKRTVCQAITNLESNHLPILRSDYSINFGDAPPKQVEFRSPLSTYAAVNSKWNQPRTTGSNPHNGVDLQASAGTNVYAPYDGWITHINITGPYDIDLLVDANNDNIKNDGDYHIRFYHMNARQAAGKVSKGALIGKSGNQGGVPAHLHFGICSTSGGLKWLRNEINYRHLSASNWNSGKDLDAYATVQWNNNSKAVITAYIRNDGAKEYFSEVRMFYRTTTSGAWTDGGVVPRSGDVYTYNFAGKVPSGTNVQWMMRLTRSGVSQAAFCPAKFYQPDNNPNATSYAYAYWTNKVS